MKNLTVSHNSIKQSLLSSLINSQDTENQRYNNIKASLLNNATVFPVNEKFDVGAFKDGLKAFFADTLKIKAEEETIGDDIFVFSFSPVGLGLMKKSIVFMLYDFHLYINDVPQKEIENANYSENKIAGLLSSGKTEQIYIFTEDYVLRLYPQQVLASVKPQGRYFQDTEIGVPTVLANHLEDGEFVLSKLDIYKVEQSKSNAQIAETDNAFYVLTTSGAYLFVTDKNLQEKYIETLSVEDMKVYSKIGRDNVTVGTTKWITNRDNDFLFDEIQSLNNKTKQEKLFEISALHFNNDEKDRAAFFMELLAKETLLPFDFFVACVLKFSGGLSFGKIDGEAAGELIEKANSLFSENSLEEKLKNFLSNFNFGKNEILSLIYVISRIKNRISDTEKFKEILLMLRDRYFKTDNSELNRAFVELGIAKKLVCVLEKTSAQKLLESVIGKVSEKSFPDIPNLLNHYALKEIIKTSKTDKEKLKYAKFCALEDPTDTKSLELWASLADEETVKRINLALAVFDKENFYSFSSFETRQETSAKFSAFSMKDFSVAVQRGGKYANLKSWTQKVSVNSAVSSVLNYAEEVNAENYPQLYALFEECKTFFEIPDVKIYVIFNRNQGVFSNDDEHGKYIVVDGEMLDTDSDSYMNYPQMSFLLAKEFANLSFGFSKMFSRAQFRNFTVSGLPALDVVAQFAPEPKFLSEDLNTYFKLSKFNALLENYPSYFDFDITDTQLCAEMLEKTLLTIDFSGSDKTVNMKEKEYSAAVLTANSITDCASLLFTGDLIFSIKAIIGNDKPQKNDFFMRLKGILKYYLSDDYTDDKKYLQKK
ncbi:MAG: hypothetical protein II956_11135 [Bacteroidales bacterium]|nr:hypothetical protein [Bacteroidales bacterium]